MVVVNCVFPGCSFATADLDAAVVAPLLVIHAVTHQAAATAAPVTAAPVKPGPKYERPKVDMGIELETWNGFVRRWETFRLGSGISDLDAPRQIFQCASESLGDVILKADPLIATRSLSDVVTVMRSYAVVPVAIGVLRAELVRMHQGSDEIFRTFAARVRGKAETCSYRVKSLCECGKENSADYTDESIRDVLLSGISDLDIRREALGTDDIQEKSINEVIAFVEGREMARNALPSSSLSALSSFKRQTAPPPAPRRPQQSQAAGPSIDHSKTAACPDCRKLYSLFTERNGRWNAKPHKLCADCWRAKNPRRSHAKPAPDNNSLSAENFSTSGDLFDGVFQVSSLSSAPVSHVGGRRSK